MNIIEKTNNLPKTQQYIYLIIILLIAYLYCIVFAVFASDNKEHNPILNAFNTMHESCIARCDLDVCIKSTGTRGTNYYIGSTTENGNNLSNCIMTFWNFTHLILFFILGLLFANLWVEIAAIGILFEIYEYYKFNCHDVLDIFYDLTGLFIGVILSRYLRDI